MIYVLFDCMGLIVPCIVRSVILVVICVGVGQGCSVLVVMGLGIRGGTVMGRGSVCV